MSNCPIKNPTEELFQNREPEDRTAQGCPDYSWQSSPLAVTATIASALTDYFSNSNNFTNKELRTMLSDASPVITQLDSVDATTTGKLPKIAVNFEGSKLVDRLEFARHNSLGYNINNSQEGFYLAWNLQHKVDIVAQTKREALLLSEAACCLFAHYQTAFLKMLQAHQFKVTQLSGASAVSEEDSSKGYIASIGLLTVTPDHWYIAESAPRLKRGITEFASS